MQTSLCELLCIVRSAAVGLFTGGASMQSRKSNISSDLQPSKIQSLLAKNEKLTNTLEHAFL